MAFDPTDEQVAVVSVFGAGADLVVEAGAGSGKTSTLRLLAGARPSGRGVYIAYNRAIADDARGSFPGSVSCATAHSLAFRAVGRRYSARLNGPRMPARQVAAVLGISGATDVDGVVLAPAQVARVVTDTVARFCQSADVRPEARHVPVLPGVDTLSQQAVLKAVVLPLARRAWTDLASVDGRLKFTHDCYLKIWQLSGPRLPADYVMLDEAQDANPVVAAVVDGQAHAQRVLVGDRCQQLYAWRGAVDAMANFAGHRLWLSQSFRFGDAIAAQANQWLAHLGSPLQLRGYGQIPSRVGPVDTPDAVLCRTNAQAVATVLAALGGGRRAALVGGGKDIRGLAEAAVTLKAGAGTSHPELFCFRTWGEVQDYVDHDSAGADLKTFVRLIDAHGPDVVIDAMDRLTDESAADLVVSTAHRAKGREWPAVTIAGDFREPAPDTPPAEAMLAYVAVTRARTALNPGPLTFTPTPATAPAPSAA